MSLDFMSQISYLNAISSGNNNVWNKHVWVFFVEDGGPVCSSSKLMSELGSYYSFSQQVGGLDRSHVNLSCLIFSLAVVSCAFHSNLLEVGLFHE